MAWGAHRVSDIRAAEEQLLRRLPPGTLMQRAAAGLAAACAGLLRPVYGSRVLLLVGAGNNGGDTLLAGGRLAARGADVRAVLASPDRTDGAALAGYRRRGGRVVGVDDVAAPVDLVVDGLVGIGGSGALRAPAADLWARARDLGGFVVAVDVPSGIGVVDGRVSGPCVRADLTVTFGTYKVGLVVGPGAAHAGPVFLVDIGLGELLPPPAVSVATAGDAAAALARLVPGPTDHKYTRGVVGVAAGSAQYPGAGVLAVAGASCGLAGMVRYLGPEPVADQIRGRFPAVVGGDGRVQAVVVGSGGGSDAGTMLAAATDRGVPLVVDADALAALTGPVPVPALLTPHAGELARLLGTERAQVEGDPLRYATAAARRFAAVVLLKGAATVVVRPDGTTSATAAAPAWLATAGSGDVLAGICGALLAATGDPYEAGRLGAWLHAAAATWASAGGPIRADDVAAAVPAVVRQLLTGGQP